MRVSSKLLDPEALRPDAVPSGPSPAPQASGRVSGEKGPRGPRLPGAEEWAMVPPREIGDSFGDTDAESLTKEKGVWQKDWIRPRTSSRY